MNETRQLHPQLRYYMNLGWALIPLRSAGKGARVKWKDIHTPPDESRLLQWQTIYGGASDWAVILGPSNLIVMDIDDLEGFKTYIRDFGLKFPQTAVVKSPGGAHLYFEAGPLDHGRTVPKPLGLAGEYRAGRGIVVLPYRKNHYTWLKTPDHIQHVPGWLRELIHARTATPPQRTFTQSKLPGNVNKWMGTGFNPDPPERHVYLVSVNRAMIDDGLDEFERLDVLKGINRIFTKGAKDDGEIERIAQWTP